MRASRDKGRVIQDLRPDASGALVSNGRYVVRADGNVVVLPDRSPLPDGWRLATEGDLKPFASAPSEMPQLPIEDDIDPSAAHDD